MCLFGCVQVYAWGKNKYGQLGLGNTKNSLMPTCILPLSDQLDPKNVRCISTGKSHSAVVGEDGDVYSWGRGWDGQLGHEVVTEIELEPRLVRSMEKLSCANIACGMAHTVAVTDTGNVWCWGDNKAGQLGNGTLTSSSVPVPVTALQEMEVVQVSPVLLKATIRC
jgi:alpha-tubulin suppressor-like RCC1 family protein